MQTFPSVQYNPLRRLLFIKSWSILQIGRLFTQILAVWFWCIWGFNPSLSTLWFGYIRAFPYFFVGIRIFIQLGIPYFLFGSWIWSLWVFTSFYILEFPHLFIGSIRIMIIQGFSNFFMCSRVCLQLVFPYQFIVSRILIQ